MIKVAGFWELGYSTPLQEFDLWSYPLREYGVDEFIMCPVSGINEKVTEYKDIEQVLEANKDLTPVYVDEKGEIELENFEHPKNALYIFGKASYSPLNKKSLSVKIITPSNKGMLWPHQCACMLLDHRYKQWQ